MRRYFLFALLLLLSACATNPYTGRSQLIFIPQESEFALGREGYQQILSEAKVSADPAQTRPVVRVGKRIAEQAERWVQEKGESMQFQWEFNVIQEDETVNAFCLPGGKIAFYTGIFPTCEDEAGIAIVMGHEVAHALLRHGAERMSQNLVFEVGALVLSETIQSRKKEKVDLAITAYGAGASLGVLLPYSRDHETEADEVGLMLAARAGYNPEAGPGFWRRMAKAGGRLPEFLSTHPDPENRARNMQKWMPEAYAFYESANKAPVSALASNSGGRSAGSANLDATALGVKGSGADRVFRFSLGNDAYLRKILVSGPGGSTTVDTNIPVSADAPVELPVGGVMRGTYTVKIEGAQSGRPFAKNLMYEVR